MPNFYDTLSVSPSASDEEIKRAYRALSLKYHPDRNTTAEAAEKMREINEAYETLGDDTRRKEYDDVLAGRHRGGGFVEIDESELQNLFGMMFGGGFPGHPGMSFAFHPGFAGQMHRPPPIIKTAIITLSQAYAGANVPVEITKWRMEGDNKVTETNTVYISVPKGVHHNESILLSGIGNEVGENKGDIKIVFCIEEDKVGPYERRGLDLIYRKHITLKESLCGFSFEIRHLSEKQLAFNNTSRTIIRPGYKKVIPGMGMTREYVTGNLIIEFEVTFPESLTEEQTEALSKILQ